MIFLPVKWIPFLITQGWIIVRVTIGLYFAVFSEFERNSDSCPDMGGRGAFSFPGRAGISHGYYRSPREGPSMLLPAERASSWRLGDNASGITWAHPGLWSIWKSNPNNLTVHLAAQTLGESLNVNLDIRAHNFKTGEEGKVPFLKVRLNIPLLWWYVFLSAARRVLLAEASSVCLFLLWSYVLSRPLEAWTEPRRSLCFGWSKKFKGVKTRI